MSPPDARRPARFACLLALLAAALPAAAGAQDVLFVRANSGSYTAQEQYRIYGLEGAGYTVTPLWAAASQTQYDTAVAAADVVYVSEDVNGADVGYKLREAPIGVVSELHDLDAEFGFSTVDGAVQSATAITLSATSHEITDGYAAGALTVTNSSQPLIYLNGTTASGGQTLASIGGSPAFVIVDAGRQLATTYNGSTMALGRRVRLPIGGDTFDITTVNADGQTLFQRAVAWALTEPSSLLLHLKMDETTGDVAVNSAPDGDDGQYVSSPTLGATGRRDGAVQFSADAAHDRVVAPADALDGQAQVSVAWWMRTSKTGEQAILSGANASFSQANAFLVFFVNHTTFRPYLDGASASLTVDSIADGNWRHCVFTHDRATGASELFINAVSAGTLSFPSRTGGISISPGGLVVAEEQDSVGGGFVASQAFDGLLDDLRIYNRILTQSEISELYGLIGHWRLDEASGTTAADSSLTGNDGAYVEGPTLGQTAVRRSGMTTTSTTQHMLAPSSESLDSLGVDGGSFSVSLWVKPGEADNFDRPLLHKGATNEERTPNLTLNFGDNRVEYAVSADGNWNAGSTSTKGLPGDRWSHLVLVKEGRQYRLYIDGQLDSARDVTGDSYGNTGPLYLGANPFTDSNPSSYDDLRIYNYAIGPDQIAELYGLVGHWRLDEASGATAADSSGIGHDGAHQGGVTAGASGPYPGDGAVAADFDGVNDHTALPNMRFDFADGFAAAVWVKPSAELASGQFQAFLDLSNGANADEVWLGWVEASGLQLYLTDTADGSPLKTIEDNQAFEPDEWVHCVAVVDADGNATLYRNGQPTKTGFYTSKPAAVHRTANTLATSPLNDRFLGSLFDVRVYNRPLSRAEVAEIYGLVGWWKLDELSGSVATDHSGMGNDGVYQGGAAPGGNGPSSGQAANAAEFTGESGDKIALPEMYIDFTSGFSMATWYKATALTDSYTDFFSLSNGSLVDDMWLGLDNTNGLDLFLSDTADGAAYRGLIEYSSPGTGGWHYAAAVVDNAGNAVLYRDGVAVASGYVGLPRDVSRALGAIGETTFDHTLEGSLFDVRLYNRPMTPDEIEAAYNAGQSSGLRIIRWVEVR